MVIKKDKNESLSDWAKQMAAESERLLGNSLEAALRSEHESLVLKASQLIGDRLQPAGGPVSERAKAEDWIGIESLSRLRSVVGGRFNNVKALWTKAGFPLKSHRGEKKENYSIEKEGWLDLSNWILKQGFESRLSDSEDFLAEVRKISRAPK